MSKRYKLFWNENAVSFGECRGKKRVENIKEIKCMEELIKQKIYSRYIEKLKSVKLNSLTEKDVKEIQTSVESEIKTIVKEDCYVTNDALYCHRNNLDIGTVCHLIAAYHKALCTGSYHLYMDDKIIVKKGQLMTINTHISPMNLKVDGVQIENEKEMNQWKKKLFYYYSEWELKELMWILVMHKVNQMNEWSPWVKERYEERVDYFLYFMKPPIEKFVFFDTWRTLK